MTGRPRDKYTLEFKLAAVRLVKGGQSMPVTAKILGKGLATIRYRLNRWELARRCAENARLRMERDILGKATAYFA